MTTADRLRRTLRRHRVKILAVGLLLTAAGLALVPPEVVVGDEKSPAAAALLAAPAIWVHGLMLCILLEAFRPFSDVPGRDRLLARGGQLLLVLPPIMAIAMIANLAGTGTGIALDDHSGALTGVAGMILIPAIAALLMAGWLILLRAGTQGNRRWFLATLTLGSLAAAVAGPVDRSAVQIEGVVVWLMGLALGLPVLYYRILRPRGGDSPLEAPERLYGTPDA